MKTSTKVIIDIAIIAVVVFVSFVAVIFSIIGLQQSTSRTGTPEPEQTTSPEPTTDPNPQSNPTITISYSVRTADSITTKYGFDMHSDSGTNFRIVDMTIKNIGYDSFNTNPYWFSAIADNVKYNYDYHEMDIVDILNGGVFSGMLVFQVPVSVLSFTLGYDAFLSEYNIV
jgi:hypothetical protein